MILDLNRLLSRVCAIGAISLIVLGLGLPSSALLKGAPQSYVYPVVAPRLTSKFGKRVHPVKKAVRHHTGIDLAAPPGAPIRAIADGVVIFADPHGGYGRLIVVKHKGDITSHYGHCESLKVQPGQKVRAGDIIGTVGQSGRVTGPHLHFELRKNGDALNPERYIPGLTSEAAG